MERFTKCVMNVQDVFSDFFAFPNTELFDEEFRQLMQIFYWFGFYQPSSSFTRRFAYGVLVFLFVKVAYWCGIITEVVASLNSRNLTRALITVPLASFSTSLNVQILTLVTKKTRIVKMIQTLHALHEYEDEALIEDYRVKCRQLVKYYKAYLQFAVIFVITLTLTGFKLYKLVIPIFYDSFADGFFFYPLMFCSVMQSYCLALIFLACDLLHVLCMIRLGANVEVLRKKIIGCAESENPSENLRDLSACVRYHSAVIQ